ncbi:MAG: hypothetical protein JNL21_29350 [Myxococcales bacterium]|nr:hypothetical protein [Myxococcales bacterium]
MTGKLPCEAGKQSIWWRIQAPAEGKTKLKLRTPKDGDQSCVHLNAYDASGKIRDTPNSTCSDQAANWAVFDDGPIKSDYVYLQLMSSMGTCFTSDFELTLSK